MGTRRGVYLPTVFVNEVINHIAVCGVNRDKARRSAWTSSISPYHLAVVNHQSAFVRHEGLEGRNSFLLDHFLNFRFRAFV